MKLVHIKFSDFMNFVDLCNQVTYILRVLSLAEKNENGKIAKFSTC